MDDTLRRGRRSRFTGRLTEAQVATLAGIANALQRFELRRGGGRHRRGRSEPLVRVVIAGGGLVGLTLGGLLRRRGISPVVIERMPAGAYVARGFMLGHQAYDAMAELDALDAIRAAGRPIGATPDGGSAATAVEVGRVLALAGRDVPVRHEHSVVDLERDPSGRVTGVAVEGPGGGEVIASDLVVACDGIRSRVRGMAGLTAEFAPMAEGKIEWMSPAPTDESFAMAYLSNGGHIGMLSWPEGSFGWRTTERVGREAALAPGLDALVASWSALLPPRPPASPRSPPSTRSTTTSPSCCRAPSGGRPAWC